MPGVDGLWTLGTRAVAANPTELLGGHRMRALVDDLAQRFDIVLIDSPPVLPVADALILSGYADAVLLVVAAGQTRRAELRRAAEKLAQASAPVVGAVLNKATRAGRVRLLRRLPALRPACEAGRLTTPGRRGTGAASRTAPARVGQPGRHGR